MVYHSKGKAARKKASARVLKKKKTKEAKQAKKKSKTLQRRHEKKRACTRKRRYETYAIATCKGFRVYKCPHCDGFHRTTDAKLKRAQNEKEL